MRDAPMDPGPYRRAAFELATDAHDQFWPAFYAEAAILLEPASASSIELRRLLFENYRDATAPDSAWVTAIGKVPFFRATGGLVYTQHWGSDDSSMSGYSLISSEILKVATLTAPACPDLLDRLAAIRTAFARSLRASEIEANGEPLKKNAIWGYHEQLIAAGHFDAYNHWLFGPGEPDSFARWQQQHRDALEALGRWRARHPLIIDRDHPVSRPALEVPPAFPASLREDSTPEPHPGDPGPRRNHP